MDGGIILLYHRVTALALDPQLLAIPAAAFAQQIRYLKSRFHIVPLNEMLGILSSGQHAGNTLAITFDDGYFDFFSEAMPILEKESVPASLFVTVGMIGNQGEFWWDELERIFLSCGEIIPPRLLCSAGRHHFDFNTRTPSSRLQAYESIHGLVRTLCLHDREAVMNSLFQWARLDRYPGRDSHRSLSKEELRELAASEFISIGSHTFSHPVLSSESLADKKMEIAKSQHLLRQWTGKEIESFSYPFGLARDFDSHSVTLVREQRYQNAVTAISANVSANSDPWQLPRRLIRNWPFFEFRKKIDKYCCDYGEKLKRDGISPANREKRLVQYVGQFQQKSCAGNGESVGEKGGTPWKKVKQILQINTHDRLGGAAKVSRVIGEMLAESNRKSFWLVKYKLGDDERVLEVGHEDGISDCLLKASFREQGWMDLYHPSAFELMVHPHFLSADLICLHNLHGDYFTPLALPIISHLKPTIWVLHDMQSFTGHCAHSFDCSQWQSGCLPCRNLEIPPRLKKDLAALNFRVKKLAIQGSRLNLVCQSKWLQDQVSHSILAECNTKRIANGVDENVFFNHEKHWARERLGLPQNRPILLFVAVRGRDNPWKGGELFPIIREHFNHSDALFVVVGDQHPPQPNVINRGEIFNEEELALTYASADLLICPSLADNSPLVVLEALACGTPVVAFAVGGIPELLAHGKNGYLVKYKDMDDFVNGIRFFLANDAIRKEACEYARRSILHHFTARRVKTEYDELFEAVYQEFHSTPAEKDFSIYEECKRIFTNK